MSVFIIVTGFGTAAPAIDQARWQTNLSAGYDAYIHSYHLATTDTTEAVSEFNVAAEVEGRSRRATSHRWHLRGELAGGTELYRQLLDGTYQWRPGASDPRFRADLTWLGRQYHQDSDYTLSSNNHEGRADLRAYPWYTSHTMLDLRLGGRYIDYRTPSSLEQDYHEEGVAGFLRSRSAIESAWRVGLRSSSRSYPDSSSIDRDVVAVEGDFEHNGDRSDLWLFHRSERRLVADETVRPSAWSHWTDLRLALPAGRGHVIANLNNEVWRYDHQTGAYFDSWRTDLEFGYRWGDLLGTLWQTLLTVDHLTAGDSPETYSQVGLRGSLESYAYPFTGIVALEYGQRWYSEPAIDLDLDDVVFAYSNFSYFEVWIMATWSMSEHFSFDLIANYQPENHTEQDDDIALGTHSASSALFIA